VQPREPKLLAAALGRVLADDELRAAMGASGMERAAEFSWERVTAKVEDYYGFVIRRIAAQGQLPAGFTSPVPASPRLAAVISAGAQPAIPSAAASLAASSRRSASAIRQLHVL
jgi:hypothetical protein